MAAAIIPAALAAIPAIGKLFGGIGGGSGSNAADNTLRQNQLQAAEQAALSGDPQAAAELAAWNRPGPTNAEAQAFMAQNPGVGQEAQGQQFSGNYGQVFSNGMGGGTVANPNVYSGQASGAGPAGGTTLGGALSPSSAGGSTLGGLLGTVGQGIAGLTAAQNLASQQAQLNASRAAAQNAYAQKAGIRGQALAGLSNSMTAPDLSADFKSSNPFANQAAAPYSGLANTQGAPVLYAGNAQSPGAYSGATIGGPTSPSATSGASLPGSVGGLAGIANAGSPMGPSATTLKTLPGSVGGIAV